MFAALQHMVTHVKSAPYCFQEKYIESVTQQQEHGG